MINIDLEKLIWMQVNEEIEVKANGNNYTLNKENIDNNEYLVFNDTGSNQVTKMNIDRSEKIRNYTRLQQESFIDDLEYFFNDIYNAYDVELSLA